MPGETRMILPGHPKAEDFWMVGKKIRTVVFLEPELGFLKRLKGSSKLVNMILGEVFKPYPGEGDKIVAAMAFLDGRSPLPVNAGETPRKETVTESDKPKKNPRRLDEPKTKRSRNLLSELSEAARDFDEL